MADVAALFEMYVELERVARKRIEQGIESQVAAEVLGILRYRLTRLVSLFGGGLVSVGRAP